MLRKGGVILASLIAVVLTGCSTRPSRFDLRDGAALTADARSASIESLDRIDVLVREHLPDADVALQAALWDDSVARCRADMAKATTRLEVRAALSRLLATLDRSHLAILPGDPSTAERTAGATLSVEAADRLPPILCGRVDDVLLFGLVAFRSPTDVASRVERTLRDNADATGVVLDLRGNPGGVLAMAAGVAGFFVDADVPLGSLVQRGATIDLIARPRSVRTDVPLAIVVDADTASAAEILAAGLQASGRARVFGPSATAGAALPAVVVDLPNGDRFQYPVANFRVADGRTLEGVGVTPDEIVDDAKDADAPLVAALRWLRTTTPDRPFGPALRTRLVGRSRL